MPVEPATFQTPLPEQLSQRAMEDVLYAAGVPEPLWTEFLNVAWCESSWRPAARSPGHAALGLWQVHDMWVVWAEENGFGTFDRLDPVDSARLTYLIGEHYDVPKYGNRWHQWSAKPWWPACERWPSE